MKAEEGILYDSSERQIIKKFNKAFPNIEISILSVTLVIKSIDLSYLS
jgi:hypothetical protein